MSEAKLDAYFLSNKTLPEPCDMMSGSALDPLHVFSEACRNDWRIFNPPWYECVECCAVSARGSSIMLAVLRGCFCKGTRALDAEALVPGDGTRSSSV